MKIEEKKTNIYFVADRSGSMYALASDVIGGFNSYVEDQKWLDGITKLTLVLFDDRYQEVYSDVDISKVPPLTKDVYYTGGMTALYDAVGKTLSTGIKKSGVNDLNILVVMTDGEENSSVEYNHASITAKIKDAQNSGWEIIFLGANMDAVKYATNMGIKSKNAATFNASSVGTMDAINTMSYATSAYRSVATGVASADMQAFACAAEDSKEHTLADRLERIRMGGLTDNR